MNTKEYASYSKLKTQLTDISKSLKNNFASFYRKHIGEIDKGSAITLNDYVVLQDEIPQGTATIKLTNNKYILQKKKEDNTYLYIPFEKKKTPVLPINNMEMMKKIESKYMKYKSFSKKQLLEKIYNENADTFKNAKLTKKTFFSDNLEILSKKLEGLGVNDLTQALDYYEITDVTSKRLKPKIAIEDIESNPHYSQVEKVKQDIEKLETHDALAMVMKLQREVEKCYNELNREVIKNMSSFKDDKYINVTTNQDITCQIIPKADFILENFFKKDIDLKRMKYDIYGGRLDVEMRTSFSFFEPCENLSEVMDRFNSIDFARNSSSELSYDANETIKLR